jgi:hypothetical protein
MPGVKILCYHYCKGARVHRWNDVPLVDAPPGNVSAINMIDHGPAQPRELFCFKVVAIYSQCKVFLHLNYIHKISLIKVQCNCWISTHRCHE